MSQDRASTGKDLKTFTPEMRSWICENSAESLADFPKYAGRSYGPFKSVGEFASEDLFVAFSHRRNRQRGWPRLRDSKNKRDLESWLRALERHYADRVLGIDLETANIWGELTAAAQAAGRIVPASDGLIAATVRRHGLHVMTRNITDFDQTGVMLLTPRKKAKRDVRGDGASRRIVTASFSQRFLRPYAAAPPEVKRAFDKQVALLPTK